MKKTGRIYWRPPNPHKTHRIPLETRKQGIVMIAGSGSGKSRIVARQIVYQDFFFHWVPSVVICPIGTIIDEFLDKVLRDVRMLRQRGLLTAEDEQFIWHQILYVDMSGKSGLITKRPVYYKLPDQSYSDASARFLDTLDMLDPQLREAPRSGRNALMELGKPVGIIITALGLGVTEAQKMLTVSKKEFKRQWEPRLRQLQAETKAYEVHQAVDYMLNKYAKLDAYNTERVTSAYLTKLSLFDDESMVAMHSATEPSIDWEEVVQRRQVVLLDFRDEHNKFKRRYKMLDVFISIREYLVRRDLREAIPFSIVIDELAELYGMDAQADNQVFGAEIVKLVDQYARNFNVWPTLLLQHPGQVDERSLQSLLSCGTVAIGRISNHAHAEMLAKTFYDVNPHLVKRFNHTPLRVGGSFTYILGKSLRYTSPPLYEMVPTNPVEYTPEEQVLMMAKLFKTSGLFQFLVKISKHEGDTAGEMRLADFTHWDRGVWVDKKTVANLRQWLLQRDWPPIEQVLAEIDARGQAHQKPAITQDRLDTFHDAAEEAEPTVPQATPAPTELSAQEILTVFDDALAEVSALPPETWQLP